VFGGRGIGLVRGDMREGRDRGVDLRGLLLRIRWRSRLWGVLHACETEIETSVELVCCI